MILAIGGNLQAPGGASPLQTCDWALQAIAAIPGVSGLVRSRWFSSAPVPASAQGRYINGVVRLDTSMAPEILLAALQDIEKRAGRVRSGLNAARTLDLDIIDMAGLIRAAPDPVLPHPRTHQRAFVLLPLRDVVPGWVHPVLGETVGSLIAALPPQDIAPL